MLKLVWVGALSIATCGAAFAADVAAGKAKFTEICSKCHVREDRTELNTAVIETKIKEIVAGKIKHKQKLQLTDAEIANLAAYWTEK